MKWAKNLQRYNQNKTVQINPTGDAITCPVWALRRSLTAVPGLSDTAPLLVFTHTGHPMPVSYIRTVWSTAVRRAGADPAVFSLHSLRKASATEAFQGGCTELEVQRHSGWASTAYKDYITTTSHNKISDTLNRAITTSPLLPHNHFLPPTHSQYFILARFGHFYTFILLLHCHVRLYLFINIILWPLLRSLSFFTTT